MTLDAFKAEVAARLTKVGLGTLADWQRERPGEHLGASYRGRRSCALCGAIEPHGGYRSACRGAARISLRGRRG